MRSFISPGRRQLLPTRPMATASRLLGTATDRVAHDPPHRLLSTTRGYDLRLGRDHRAEYTVKSKRALTCARHQGPEQPLV
jgi:hypothetical protein